MSTQALPCGWRCGDDAPDHKHYAVLARENGRLLGRLTPQGATTNRRLFAAVLSKARAEEIARAITADDTLPGVTAKAIPF